MFLVFLDTETHAKENPILIQLAYNRITSLGVVSVNEYFSTGGVPIDFGAMAVHHITEDIIKDKPLFTGSETANNLQYILDNDNIIVAHNALFDVGVLRSHGIKIDSYICTLKLARDIYPEFDAHNLQYLRYRLGLKTEGQINPHDAMSDVIVLQLVFQHLREKMLEKYTDISNPQDHLKKMIKISLAPSLLYKCMFGKYAGKLWSEVPTDYLDWIVNKSGMDDEDVLHTAKYYLFAPKGPIQ